MSTVPRDVRICGSGFFFKHKTAYEMRISDWSSDVCSSDLTLVAAALRRVRLRHDRALETVRGSFLQALFSVGDRPDLAAETNFTEGHGLVGQRLVAHRRPHRQHHRQVSLGFLPADAPNHVVEPVLFPDHAPTLSCQPPPPNPPAG